MTRQHMGPNGRNQTGKKSIGNLSGIEKVKKKQKKKQNRKTNCTSLEMYKEEKRHPLQSKGLHTHQPNSVTCST